MKLFVALFALAAAQDQGAETTQGADASQGYGEEQSYAAAPTTSYGEESYAPAYVKVHHVCLGECFEEAPCLNTDTGACVPKVGGNFAAAPAYGAQQTGYRRLAEESDNSYGYEAPAAQSYAAPVESYAAPVAYSAPAPEFGCPDGTVDTGCMYVSKAWPFWVGFILLFLPSFYFLCEVYWVITTTVSSEFGEVLDTAYLRRNVRGLHFLAAGFVLTIASLAYLTMATGHGYILRCCDGRSFYYTRYIDWTLTTPIMLWELATICTNVKQWHFTWLFFLDVLMIISGLIGSLMCGGEKWIFWGFGVICFIPVIALLCQFDYFLQATRYINNSDGSYIQYFDESFIQIANDRPSNETNGTGDNKWKAVPNSGHIYESVIERLQKYRTAMYLTVIAWFFYPIVWIFAEGTGSLCSMGEAICYTVLDVISKSVFAWIIVEGRAANNYHTIRFRINSENGRESTEWIYIDPTHYLAFPLPLGGAHGHSKSGTFAEFHN
jgi:bacteriorhodopsin